MVYLEAADVLMRAASAEVEQRAQLEELMKIASETDTTFEEDDSDIDDERGSMRKYIKN